MENPLLLIIFGLFVPANTYTTFYHSAMKTIVKSTNYPNHYPSNEDKVWVFKRSTGIWTITIQVFQIQSSPLCLADYLQFHRIDRLSFKICDSSNEGDVFYSQDSFFNFTFHSDGKNESKGFFIVVEHFKDKESAVKEITRRRNLERALVKTTSPLKTEDITLVKTTSPLKTEDITLVKTTSPLKTEDITIKMKSTMTENEVTTPGSDYSLKQEINQTSILDNMKALWDNYLKLPIEAQVLIGVLIPFVVILVFAIVFSYFCWRRKIKKLRRKKQWPKNKTSERESHYTLPNHSIFLSRLSRRLSRRLGSMWKAENASDNITEHRELPNVQQSDDNMYTTLRNTCLMDYETLSEGQSSSSHINTKGPLLNCLSNDRLQYRSPQTPYRNTSKRSSVIFIPVQLYSTFSNFFRKERSKQTNTNLSLQPTLQGNENSPGSYCHKKDGETYHDQINPPFRHNSDKNIVKVSPSETKERESNCYSYDKQLSENILNSEINATFEKKEEKCISFNTSTFPSNLRDNHIRRKRKSTITFNAPDDKKKTWSWIKRCRCSIDLK